MVFYVRLWVELSSEYVLDAVQSYSSRVKQAQLGECGVQPQSYCYRNVVTDLSQGYMPVKLQTGQNAIKFSEVKAQQRCWFYLTSQTGCSMCHVCLCDRRRTHLEIAQHALRVAPPLQGVSPVRAAQHAQRHVQVLRCALP